MIVMSDFDYIVRAESSQELALRLKQIRDRQKRVADAARIRLRLAATGR